MSLPPDARPAAHNESASDEPSADGLDDLLRPRLSRRARQLRAGLLVTLVAVVVAGLFWRTTGFGLQVPTAQRSLATYRLAPPGVRILSNIGFGSVSVNGQRVGALPAVAELRSGQNTITLDAPPFRPHTCSITWPFGAPGDLACLVNVFSDPQTAVSRGQRIVLGGELDIEMVGADLPAGQCAGALNAVTRALDATVLTTTVPAGQHIATEGASPEGIPASKIAPADLRARLIVQPRVFTGRPCTSLLYGGVAQPYYAVPQPERAWSVNVPVEEQMTFAGADGHVVSRTAMMEGSVGVILGVLGTGEGEWQLAMMDPPLSSQITGNLCDGGIQALSKAFSLTHPGASWGIGPSTDGGLEGCQLELATFASAAETDTHYLWRFGVLLATDVASRQILPMLPLASAGELAAIAPNA